MLIKKVVLKYGFYCFIFFLFNDWRYLVYLLYVFLNLRSLFGVIFKVRFNLIICW